MAMSITAGYNRKVTVIGHHLSQKLVWQSTSAGAKARSMTVNTK